MANKIGFWKEKDINYPDLNWFQSEEYHACIKYLNAGRKYKGYKGWANCRICKARLGTYDMISYDKKWIYPEGYEHYLIEHKLKPSRSQFIIDAVNWTRGLR